MNALELILFVLLLAIAVWLLRVFTDPSDDDAAHVSLNRASSLSASSGERAGGEVSSAAAPAPADHFISICSRCQQVTRLEANTVTRDNWPIRCIRQGDRLRISHGLCPACYAATLAEADAELARVQAPDSGQQLANA